MGEYFWNQFSYCGGGNVSKKCKECNGKKSADSPPPFFFFLLFNIDRSVIFDALFKDEYANTMGIFYEGPTEFQFCVDPAGQAFVPKQLHDDIIAGRVVSDGNCFFRALSLRLFGTQATVTVCSYF